MAVAAALKKPTAVKQPLLQRPWVRKAVHLWKRSIKHARRQAPYWGKAVLYATGALLPKLSGWAVSKIPRIGTALSRFSPHALLSPTNIPLGQRLQEDSRRMELIAALRSNAILPKQLRSYAVKQVAEKLNAIHANLGGLSGYFWSELQNADEMRNSRIRGLYGEALAYARNPNFWHAIDRFQEENRLNGKAGYDEEKHLKEVLAVMENEGTLHHNSLLPAMEWIKSRLPKLKPGLRVETISALKNLIKSVPKQPDLKEGDLRLNFFEEGTAENLALRTFNSRLLEIIGDEELHDAHLIQLDSALAAHPYFKQGLARQLIAELLERREQARAQKELDELEAEEKKKGAAPKRDKTVPADFIELGEES